MLVFLLLAATAAAIEQHPEQRLPFLPGGFMNNSSPLAARIAKAALHRFHSLAGGPEVLAHQKEILSALSVSESSLLRRITTQEADAIAALTARLKGTAIDRPSVADINRPIAEYLYHGDVRLSQADVDRLTAESTDITSRRKRGAPVVISTRWSKTQPIGFVFNGDIDENTRKSIRTATQQIAANTCLSFRENFGVGTQLQFHRGGGCWSYIGQQPGARQPISIDVGCEIIGIIAHEIAHALGLDHTQNRKDRDAFISVNMAAIAPNQQHNFAKLADAVNNNFGVLYDYGSDLHYGAFDFSTNGQATLVATQADYINTMGQRKYLTFTDYKMINALYDCSANCPRQIVCQNGGYPSPKNCNACACPDFYTGTNCQTPRTTISITTSNPGRTAYHQDYNETLYTSGNHYNSDMFGRDAVKIIRAPTGRKIRVTINEINAAFGQLPCYLGCPFTGLEFVDNEIGDLTTMGKIFCCSKDEKTSFVSRSNIIGYKAYASPGMPFDGKVTYTVV